MANDTIDEVEDPIEDQEGVEEEDPEAAEPSEDDLADAAADTPDPASRADVESIQEILVKQEAADEAADAPDEEDEAAAVTLTKGDKLEPTDSRVVPIQASEFTCTNCYLVKHRSQLANKKKMLCRDCA